MGPLLCSRALWHTSPMPTARCVAQGCCAWLMCTRRHARIRAAERRVSQRSVTSARMAWSSLTDSSPCTMHVCPSWPPGSLVFGRTLRRFCIANRPAAHAMAQMMAISSSQLPQQLVCAKGAPLQASYSHMPRPAQARWKGQRFWRIPWETQYMVLMHLQADACTDHGAWKASCHFHAVTI